MHLLGEGEGARGGPIKVLEGEGVVGEREGARGGRDNADGRLVVCGGYGDFKAQVRCVAVRVVRSAVRCRAERHWSTMPIIIWGKKGGSNGETETKRTRKGGTKEGSGDYCEERGRRRREKILIVFRMEETGTYALRG